ncbi:MAG: HupE/UreJ family protein [Rhodobacteraceae bacterium]|nr:HupE/UreJ family protein [Paracoccaceae bacterium]
MRVLLLLVAVIVVSVATPPAQAHRMGESYVYLNVSETALSGRFEITLDHLNQAVPLDENGDQSITAEEFEAQVDRVYSYIEPRLRFYSSGAEHGITISGHDFLELDTATYAQIRFDVPTLGAPPETMEAEYAFLFDGADPSHRGLLLIESNPRAGIEANEAQHSLIFGPGEERQSFSMAGPPWGEVFIRFIGQGVYHIVPIGYDHILFLVSLLLPSVLIQQSSNSAATGKWEAAPGFREPFVYVLKVVTFFTIAHTITLSLAALGVVRFPVMLVEAVIAASIIIVALNNIFPVFRGNIWVIVFLLGLFHGFGFANVLDPLGAQGPSLVPALAGFNIGVELGQLIVVVAAFPILFLIRRATLYQPIVLRTGSAALIAVAAFWFFERTFDVFGPLGGNVISAIVGA